MNNDALQIALKEGGFKRPSDSFLEKVDSDFIKNTRIKTGLTVEEVATVVGVAKNTVSGWENGTIKAGKKSKILYCFMNAFPERGVSLYKAFKKEFEMPQLINPNLIQLAFYDNFFRGLEQPFVFRLEDTPNLLKEKYVVKVSDKEIIKKLKMLFTDLVNFGDMDIDEEGRYRFLLVERKFVKKEKASKS